MKTIKQLFKLDKMIKMFKLRRHQLPKPPLKLQPQRLLLLKHQLPRPLLKLQQQPRPPLKHPPQRLQLLQRLLSSNKPLKTHQTTMCKVLV
jgi:hypothetical protein